MRKLFYIFPKLDFMKNKLVINDFEMLSEVMNLVCIGEEDLNH